MLDITVGKSEGFDEKTQEFVNVGGFQLQLEHSLFSLSKWEQKWELPFMASDKTSEQTVDYIRCMTLTPNVSAEVYESLTAEDINTINEYISLKSTATWFAEEPKRPGSKEVVTAEIIYYWMVSMNIPLDFENRHLNHLLTLVRVINKKNEPASKKSKRPDASALARRAELNAQRKSQMKTQG